MKKEKGTQPVIPVLVGAILGFTLAALLFTSFDRRINILAEINRVPLPPTPRVVPPMTEREKEETEAQKLKSRVRVLCWVMTIPINHDKKASAIKKTWGSRCNKLIFMSSMADPSLPAVALPIKQEGRKYLWQKTKEAVKYLYEHHLDDAEWFMKADDDAFVIVENLRYMLRDANASEPVYYGDKYKFAGIYEQEVYMGGGAGYVLSKAALKKLVEDAFPDPQKCRENKEMDELLEVAEDKELGQCMRNVGVRMGDSRDELGKSRFFPFVPEQHLVPGQIPQGAWYWSWSFYPQRAGPDCCSSTAISFHYISPEKMVELNYLIYTLQPYGIR